MNLQDLLPGGRSKTKIDVKSRFAVVQEEGILQMWMCYVDTELGANTIILLILISTKWFLECYHHHASHLDFRKIIVSYFINGSL